MSTSTSALVTGDPSAAGDRPPYVGDPRVDIIGIGVMKAATSWLFRCLAGHPEIRTAADPHSAVAKELNFFNHEWEKGYAWYHRGFRFGPWKTMEFSVLYFHDANVPMRIRLYHPGVRLVVALRNPIDRAFSQHKHEIRRGRLPHSLHDFWAAFAQNPSYFEQGRYATHLSRWMEQFSRKQILVVSFDDIRARPEETLRVAMRFAGIDDSFIAPRIGEPVNSWYSQRSVRVSHLLRTASTTIRGRFGERAVRAAKATGVPRMIRRVNRVRADDSHVHELTTDDRRRLSDLFAREIEQLSSMLRRDFNHWIE